MNKLIKLLLNTALTTSLAVTAVAVSAGSAEEDQTSGQDIRIFSDKRSSIEEYRSNGRVYMIKITPSKGPSYYLIDADGDGDMETRKNDLSPNLLIPSWVLFRW